MPENTPEKTAKSTLSGRPVRETPERETAASAPAEKAERSDKAVKEFLSKRAKAVEETEDEVEAKVREDLERLWPTAK